MRAARTRTRLKICRLFHQAFAISRSTMSQQTPATLITPAGRNKLIEDGLYANYLAYFRKAEDTRRWKLHKDIPWELCKPDMPEDVAIMVEGYFAVESYLPDFVTEAMQMVRRSRGRA